jgi:NTP pyrophosphatase (non-canonical NTP hydrolase)
MDLSKIQNNFKEFLSERHWDKFRASQVFSHLIEELGEISRHITIEEGYKIVGIGHEAPSKNDLSQEFAQVFNLLLQLAIHFDVDLESSYLTEIEQMKSRFPAKEWRDALSE